MTQKTSLQMLYVFKNNKTMLTQKETDNLSFPFSIIEIEFEMKTF